MTLRRVEDLVCGLVFFEDRLADLLNPFLEVDIVQGLNAPDVPHRELQHAPRSRAHNTHSSHHFSVLPRSRVRQPVRAFSPTVARAMWSCFLVNATDLIDNARLLADSGRSAHARTLLVTSWCEIGRALLVADAFAQAWRSRSTTQQRIPGDDLVDRSTLTHYCHGFVTDHILEEFWGMATPATGRTTTDAAQREADEALLMRRWATFTTIDTGQ